MMFKINVRFKDTRQTGFGPGELGVSDNERDRENASVSDSDNARALF